jgi:dihydrodipicolinate synthase/N-acetylneuraminate lyase
VITAKITGGELDPVSHRRCRSQTSSDAATSTQIATASLDPFRGYAGAWHQHLPGSASVPGIGCGAGLLAGDPHGQLTAAWRHRRGPDAQRVSMRQAASPL